MCWDDAPEEVPPADKIRELRGELRQLYGTLAKWQAGEISCVSDGSKRRDELEARLQYQIAEADRLKKRNTVLRQMLRVQHRKYKAKLG